MKTLIKSNFFVSEKHPYLYPLNTIEVQQESLVLPIGNYSDYKNNNFGILLKIASSVGSCSLSKLLDIDIEHYFIGNKLRIRRCNNNIHEGLLTIKSKAIRFNKQTGKSLVEIFDENSVLAYSFELDYTIFSKQIFQKLFRNHCCETIDNVYSDELPNISIIESKSIEHNSSLNICSHYQNNDSYLFTLLLDEFTNEHCLGHFKNYPIVPSVFIANCLLKGLKKWLQITNKIEYDVINIDNLEIYQNKAMPIRVKFKAVTTAKIVLSNVYLFTSTIIDEGDKEYGVYLITVQI